MLPDLHVGEVFIQFKGRDRITESGSNRRFFQQGGLSDPST